MKNLKSILHWFNREISKEDLHNSAGTFDANLYEKIAHYSSQIDVPKVNINDAFDHFNQSKLNTKKAGKVITFSYKSFYKYAAILVVLITTSYFLFQNTKTSYHTAFVETTSFNLPDESIVDLNANSTIKFNQKNWNKNRSLNLEGEAFFKVQKGKTFSVNTTVGVVKVVGTQFNVKERKNYFEVKCYEGTVQVDYKNTSKKLTKGMIFKVVNQQIDSVSMFNVDEISWLQKESNFTRVPLAIVLDELKNQYDINIQTKDIDVNQLYSGGFTHADINLALQSITVPLQLSYKIDKKTVIIYNYGS